MYYFIGHGFYVFNLTGTPALILVWAQLAFLFWLFVIFPFCAFRYLRAIAKCQKIHQEQREEFMRMRRKEHHANMDYYKNRPLDLP